MKENVEETHISITTAEGMPVEITQDDLAEFGAEELIIKSSKYEVEAYAAMEWIVPTIVAGYVLKPYFEGFFSKLGEHHLDLAKNGFKKLTKKFRTLDVKTITSEGAVDKINKGYTQSQAISITFQSKGDRRVKLLFDRTLEQSDWNTAIDQLFDTLLDNYKNYPNDEFTEEIKELHQHKNFTIYVLIDKETKQIKFYDDHKLLAESRAE